MSLQNRIKLLRRYLQGKTSEQENSMVNEWYQSVDDAQPVTPLQDEATRQAIKQSMAEALAGHLEKRNPSGRKLIYLNNRKRWFAAAGIIFALFGGYGMYLLLSKRSKPVTTYLVMTGFGEIKKIQLSDSSTVWLKAGTTLRYASDYGETARKLELVNGEAFFVVMKDSTRPFIVSTGSLSTRVLGTAFNIQAYNNRPHIQVWVQHGIVQVSDSNNILKKLTRNMRLEWDRTSRQYTCDSLYWRMAMDWQKGILSLEAASFGELSAQLKDIYNIHLITSDTLIRSLKYDAKFFIKTPVEDIVAVLAEVHNIQYKRDGNAYTFYK